MKLKEKQFEVQINRNSEIISIKFNEKEILYQANESWKKQFPIIFPSLGFSKGFTHNGKSFNMPKHGFWKELKWENFYEDKEILSVATIHNKEKFPFILDITQRIGIDQNTLYINYEITNLDKEDAYFQFGIHPAFKIDNETFINNIKTLNLINLEGELLDEVISINGIPLKSLKFGVKYDTLIARQVKNQKITLNTSEHKLHFTFDSPHLQIWKPQNDNFVCIEPWYGKNDIWYNAPSEVSEKEEIISLKSGLTWSATFELEIEKNKSFKAES